MTRPLSSLAGYTPEQAAEFAQTLADRGGVQLVVTRELSGTFRVYHDTGALCGTVYRPATSK